uniref:Two component response transcriptional regulator n=1 Tax=uncultured Chloroflexota bacterium TaxID=166587 RepID=H5SN36_9CHLR|nr:two component response transcriptional regulator [uncultured Chloroflexota bacterium]
MNEAVARLVISDGWPEKIGQEIALHQDVTTLGRMADCQIVIDSQFVSRRHAQIIRRGQGYWLRDLGSKNGTLVNNEPVTTETLLKDGALIQVGQVTFRFVEASITQTYPISTRPPMKLRVDAASRQVWLGNQKLSPPLSLKQFNLLLYLYQRTGQAVSKDEIAAAVWPEVEAIYDYQVDKMVSRLRKRIGAEWIETVWGYGYRLRPEL